MLPIEIYIHVLSDMSDSGVAKLMHKYDDFFCNL